MILIYSHTTSPRLQYSCNFIFKELLGIDFTITIDSEEFRNYEGVKINYSNQQFQFSTFTITPHSLLFEIEIKAQQINCFENKGYKAFFKIADADFPFDIFAATFYLLSRYEEYLPHIKDMYGRYAHKNSLAFKEGFLQLPLINIGTRDFALELQKKYSIFNVQFNPELSRRTTFNFVPTYDIDIAFSYKHKGLLRNIGGFLKSPSLQRIKILLGLQKDSFDAYHWLNDLHQQNKLQPIYFFLVAEKNSHYDKNILPHKDAMWQLIKLHAKKYLLGIHPSWQSGDKPQLLKEEINWLSEVVNDEVPKSQHQKIYLSRQHYIRFNLPEGYQKLIEAGITDDYSMGYGSINGFRASVASSFFWYDLQLEQQTNLRIHPFCFMDANSFYEQQFSAGQAYEEMMQYYKICKEVNGTLITIWHNNFLGTAKEFDGWREVYEEFIRVVRREW
ncbi:polysaccharide deacetylase family protein [Ferruginibacter sp.]